ncbi:MAG: peptidylprolyl isomerase [Rhodospirillales bacterium]|nr:peptidylprolyl isomerase [Rhodospirillales bacterium]
MQWIAFSGALVIGAAVFVTPTLAAEPAAKPDVVVATVNGAKIMRSEVDEAQSRLPEEYRSFPQEVLFTLLLNSLIDTRLKSGEARRQGLEKDAEHLRQMARIEDQLLERLFLSRTVDVKMTDAALTAHHAKMVKEKGPAGEEVRARHILVDTEAEAKEIIAALGRGTDFADLARQRSKDGASRAGGDLGFFTKDKMVGPFADAAFALGVNQTSKEPVRTQFGWHVIRVEERRAAQASGAQVEEEEVRTDLQRQLSTAVVNELRGRATVERLNADGTPAAK